jgi:hypothetical protein
MISDERIEELRVFLLTLNKEGWSPGRKGWADDVADLLSLLDEVRGLRQEMVIKVGALKTLSGLEEAWIKEKARAEKAEKDAAMFKDFLDLMTKRANKAEAALDLARPLLEAAENNIKLGNATNEPSYYINGDGYERIFSAALDYQRKVKGEK